MYQHITAKQWVSLSGEADLKARDYLDSIGLRPGADIPEFWTIGRMIEFLDLQSQKNDFDFIIRFHSDPGGRTGKPGTRLIDLDGVNDDIEDEIDLVDALWKACKKVFEEK